MKIRMIGAALSALLVVGLLGVPALAAPTNSEVAVFQGEASVGKGFRNINTRVQEDCTKQTAHEIEAKGNGLGLPDNDQKKNGTWRIKVGLISPTGPAQLDACGYLTHVVKNQMVAGEKVGGIGAACGMSKGYNGVGKIRFIDDNKTAKKMYDAAGNRAIKLSGLGWKASVGGTLPILGRGHEINTAAKSTKTKAYQVAAVVQAQGAAGCLEPNGAKTFVVAGVASLLWSDGQEGLTWNDITDLGGPKDDGPLGGDKKSGTGPKSCNAC